MAKLRGFVTSAGQRLLLAAVVGCACLGVALIWHGGLMALLLGWDGGAVVYLALVWWTVRRLGPEQTSTHALREDPTIGVSDLVLLAASVISIVGEGAVMTGAKSGGAATVAIAVTSLVLSWFVVQVTFMLRYARLYYGDKPGGIGFNQSTQPKYSDFAYLAFTVGMTYQVSDTEIQTSRIRATIMRQALLSYVFGAIIVASTVNLIAGLGS